MMTSQFVHGRGAPFAIPATLTSGPTVDEADGRRIPGEDAWRQPAPTPDADAAITASRWIDDRSSGQADRAQPLAGRHLIAIAMRTTRLRLSRACQTIFDGVMSAGSLYVVDARLPLKIDFQAPCDFIHLYVPDEWLLGDPSGQTATDCLEPGALDGFVMRDALAEGLARSLIEIGPSYSDRYAESVGQTIVMRLLGQWRQGPKVGGAKVSPLPRWRLKRVQEYVAANIGETVSLPDLASAAGLSRMHFAAQFRAATGYRPHEYLIFCRIERAKAMLSQENTALVDVALSVGFQAQAHFSTVFKRLTGQTPMQWRRASLNASPSPAPARRRRHEAQTSASA